IPGGAVELGEAVRDAAVREFSEECGGEIQLRDVVDVVDIFWQDEHGKLQYHYVVVDFWAEWRGGEVKAQSDVLDARWVAPADLDQYELPLWTRAVMEKAIALRDRARAGEEIRGNMVTAALNSTAEQRTSQNKARKNCCAAFFLNALLRRRRQNWIPHNSMANSA